MPGPIMKRFMYIVIFAYVVVVCVDFVFQKRDFMDKMKMSKDEVKREYKEMEEICK
jgi:type III secretion protein U